MGKLAPGIGAKPGSSGLSLGAGGSIRAGSGPGRGQTGAFRGSGLVGVARGGARDRAGEGDGNLLSTAILPCLRNTDQTDQTDLPFRKKSCALVEKPLDLLARKSIMDVIRAGVQLGIGGGENDLHDRQDGAGLALDERG